MAPVGAPVSRFKHFRKWGRDLFATVIRAVFTSAGFLAWLTRWRGTGSDRLVTKKIDKILLIRLDLLGDIFLTLPAVAAIRRRYPDAQMNMLALPYTAPALKLFPYVDQVLTFDINRLRPSGDMLNPTHYRDLWRLIRKLRKERYDLCVSFYGLYAGLLSFLSGSRVRIGYLGEGCPFLFTTPLPGKRYSIRQHEALYNLALARAAGASEPAELKPSIPAETLERVSVLLEEAGVSTDDLLIAFHPGSANGAAKRWPGWGWARLAESLTERLGARIVLTGVASELPLAQDITRQTSTRLAITTGRTSILEAAALLTCCKVLVTGDSAPAHMASALGVPVVALYGPTDPAISGPYGGRSIVLRKKTGCSPCYDLSNTAECRKTALLCMEAITPEEVFEAVKEILRTPAPAAPGRAA
ncbi:MAG: lipopolysaccharide heptosyltransferase II [Dehalococcoidia bacterium]|nr:lipopolysaccharide heptosyltransferase II [Dehalococcoidia bacterium]